MRAAKKAMVASAPRRVLTLAPSPLNYFEDRFVRQ
jgi:hypothetical protein